MWAQIQGTKDIDSDLAIESEAVEAYGGNFVTALVESANLNKAKNRQPELRTVTRRNMQRVLMRSGASRTTVMVSATTTRARDAMKSRSKLTGVTAAMGMEMGVGKEGRPNC